MLESWKTNSRDMAYENHRKKRVHCVARRNRFFPITIPKGGKCCQAPKPEVHLSSKCCSVGHDLVPLLPRSRSRKEKTFWLIAWRWTHWMAYRREPISSSTRPTHRHRVFLPSSSPCLALTMASQWREGQWQPWPEYTRGRRLEACARS